MPRYLCERLLLGTPLVLVCLILGQPKAKEVPPPIAGILTGKVIAVADGDTLTILDDHEVKHRVRLHGIDCPERTQPFSRQAKELTGALAFGKNVIVLVKDEDRYGRMVGEVILPNGDCLNKELVRAGLAWWYRRYAPADQELKQLELEARQARRGLWGEPAPVPPWEWRRRR